MALSELASEYWQWQRMSRGDRAERLAAEADSSPYDAVSEALVDPVYAIEVVDALLHHAEADPVAVGCGPLEDLLARTPSAAVDVASRCRKDAAWREATSHVVLDPVPDALAEYVAH